MNQRRLRQWCALWMALVAAGCAEQDDEGGGGWLEAGAVHDAAMASDAGGTFFPPGDGAVGMDASGPADAAAPFDAALPIKDAATLDAGHDAASPDAASPDAGLSNAETGRLVGITAAHNMVRAMVQTATALPPLEWSPTLAAYAQQWADTQASTACSAPSHRSGADLMQKGYGENLAVFGAIGTTGNISTAQQATESWAGEVACWTYGTISGFGQQGTEKCDQTCYKALHSDGCGHYTQIVWRKSLQLGCGVATCNSSRGKEDIWICNYGPAGNFVGMAPY